MKNILFFPNYLGGGFGHIGRCLALADTWKQHGGEALFAMNGPHMGRVRQAGYECCMLETPHMHRSASNSPAYIYLTGMAYQIVRDGFDHPRVVERAIHEALQIIDRVKPDVLVGDGWPLTSLVASQAKLPVVQLVKSVVRPDPEPLTWWESPPSDIIPPDPCPVFNPVLLRYGIPPITRAEELLNGDLLLIPSMPELDPVSFLPPNTFYVGPIIRRPDPSTPLPARLTEMDGTKPIVYVTVGGAAGHGGVAEFFHLVDTALRDVDCQVVVSAGGKSSLPKDDALSPNIHLEQWVPNWAVLPRCQTVVFHGGYTRMEILEQGLPSIVIPFHSEQEFYGRQMEKTGAALCLPYSNAPYIRRVERWRGGCLLKIKRYTIHFRPKPTLTPQALRQAVEHTLTDDIMQDKACELQRSLRAYGGSEQAIALIQSRLGSRWGNS